MKKSFYLLIIIAFVTCKQSENQNNSVQIIALLNQKPTNTNQNQGQTVANSDTNTTSGTSENIPVTSTGQTTSTNLPQNNNSNTIPNQNTTQNTSNQNQNNTFEFKIESTPGDFFYYGFNAGVGFQKNYPPEGIWDRSVIVTLGGGYIESEYSNIDCATLGPLPNSAPTDHFINSVSIWKKNSDGSFTYFTDTTLECSNTINYTIISLIPKTLPRYRQWFFTSLQDMNAMWFEPNSTYRILVSSEITDRKGRKVQKTNSLGNINGLTGKYFGIEFNTTARPNYKSFFDIYSDEEQIPYRIGYNSLSGQGYSNCIEVIGTDFHNKTKSEIHAIIPELKNVTPFPGQSEWGGGCEWKTPQYSSATVEYIQPNVQGSCILNPGKSNEYRITYATGFEFNLEKLKQDCGCRSGIWRNNSYALTNTHFDKTRYSMNSTDKQSDLDE